MKRTMICAAVVAAAIGLAVPAQAMPVNATLNADRPATVQLAGYWDHHRHHHRYYREHSRRWWNSYAYRPYRHCWTVRTWHGWVRQCNW